MSNLTSTAPLAFNTVYSLINAVGAAQSPLVSVYHSELLTREPPAYVLLTGIENHRWEWSALGSFAFEEDYDIVGYASYYQGNVDPDTIITDTYSLFQTVVQSTIVANRTPPISSACQSAGVLEIIPGYSRYTSGPGADGAGNQMGFFGKIEFSYHVRGRVTVTTP